MAYDADLQALPDDHARGIAAHDLNNLLQVILAAGEAIASRLEPGSEARELAELSQTAAERGAILVRRILDASAPAPRVAAGPSERLACVPAVLRDAVGLARLAHAPARYSLRLQDAPLRCAVDAGALQDAVLNLCANAAHAVERSDVSRRDVRIDAASVGLDAADAARLGLTPGDYVRIRVADRGCGMSPESLAKACEPGFTTRRGQGGSGLGLWSLDRFAREAGGRFELRSVVGRGTTATLHLPAAR